MPTSRRSMILLVLMIVGATWIWTNRIPAQDSTIRGNLPPAPMVGYPAPDFTLATTSGDVFTLSDLRGTPVVLNFWATWCPPCREELPELQSASVTAGDRFAVVGVNQAESATDVRSFSERMALTFVIPLDVQAVVSRQYGVRSLPTTFFIDRDGIIREIQSGAVTTATLAQLLRSIDP